MTLRRCIVVPRRSRIYVGGPLLIVLGCLTIAVLNRFRYPANGIVFATAFGQTTLAATWTALGPSRLIWRFSLSLIWIGLLTIALVIQFGGGPYSVMETGLVFGTCLLGQWFLLQLPLWGLAIGFSLRLGHRDEVQPSRDRRDWQFGIHHLLLLTASVGVVLGAGRFIAIRSGQNINALIDNSRPLAILAMAAAVLTLPLTLAAILAKRAAPVVLLVLLLIGLATVWEASLFNFFDPRARTETEDFVWINVGMAVWILAFALAARVSGYRLAVAKSLKESSHESGEIRQNLSLKQERQP